MFAILKAGCIIVIFFSSVFCPAQIFLEGSIKDAITKKPIAFCAIGLKNSTKGWLSNEDGIFTINGVHDTDSLVVVFLGYRTKLVSIPDLKKNSIIYLENKTTTLAEVVVNGDDNYLFEMMDKCRTTLFNPKECESRVYFVLETEIAEQPVELLECYYNGIFNNNFIKELHFKNGRVGKTFYLEDRNFSNISTSKAFMLIDLLNEVERIPIIPFQLNKKKLRKAFKLELNAQLDEGKPAYVIEFRPVQNKEKYFEGQAWIEKKTGRLKKIKLDIHETVYHPFVPMRQDIDEIKSVSMQIIKTYSDENGENNLNHINFNYQLNYHHIPGSVSAKNHKDRDTTFEVKSKGLMYFYDYNNQFYIPDFNFSEDQSDYRKISSLTYNASFWNSNTGLVYTDKMKKAIRYFKVNGYFLNYSSGLNNKSETNRYYRSDNGETMDGQFYENTYLTWTNKTRLSLKKDGLKNDTTQTNSQIKALLYQLKAQIFFDINPVGDSLQHYSICVFDVFDTYYNLPEEPFTNCFMNIYFDLFEIERRKMENILVQKKFSIAQMDSVYKQATFNLDRQTAEYFKQVERGKNFKQLEKWNDLVKQQLGIDNIAIFQIREGK